ncbi:MAG: cupredoxin domain-containing protein [Actinobacteria bacterium]|nr:cupredoxin domain-containing protein [Actinomycetota bacterium]
MRRAIGPLLGLLLLAGCTGTAPTTTAPGTSASASTGASASTEVPRAGSTTVEITLADGKADPNGQRLELAKGTTLILQVTADHADEVHVHGYDIEIEVAAGKTVTKEIVLDQVGRFEVESHEPPLTILQLVVS